MDEKERSALSAAAGSATAGPGSDVKKLILGGGLGALLGGGVSAYMASEKEDDDETPEERRKRILNKALMGAAGGAGVGMIPGGLSMMGSPDNKSPDRTSKGVTDRLFNDEAGTIGSRITNAIGQWNPWNVLPWFKDTGESKGLSAFTSALAVPGGLLGASLPSPKAGIGNTLSNSAFKTLANNLQGGSSLDSLRKLLNNSNPNKGKILSALQSFSRGGRHGLDAIQRNLLRSSSHPAGINNKNVNQAIAAWRAAGGDSSTIRDLLNNNSTVSGKYSRVGSVLGNLRAAGTSDVLKGLARSGIRRTGGGLAGFATPLIASFGLDQMDRSNGLSNSENFSDLTKYVTASILQKKDPKRFKAYLDQNGLGKAFFDRMKGLIDAGEFTENEVGALANQISSSL